MAPDYTTSGQTLVAAETIDALKRGSFLLCGLYQKTPLQGWSCGIIPCVMRFILYFLTISSMLLLGGCFSMETASNAALRNSAPRNAVSKPVEHILVSNYGWYLFNCIPLVCGNANPDASWPWIFFSDHVNSILLHDRLMEYASSNGASVKNIVFSRDEEVLFDIPGSDIPFPIPYLVCYREIQFSGILTKRTAANSATEKECQK